MAENADLILVVGTIHGGFLTGRQIVDGMGDPLRAPRSFTERLEDTTTNENGEVEVELGVVIGKRAWRVPTNPQSVRASTSADAV